MAMVVLVRCNDGTYSVAMESCLDELIRGGLVSAYLSGGDWVKVPVEQQIRKTVDTRRNGQWAVAAAA